MSLQSSLAILGLALTAFFSLGGVQKTKNLVDNLKSNPDVAQVVKVFQPRDETSDSNSSKTVIDNKSKSEPQVVPNPPSKFSGDTKAIIDSIKIDSRNIPIPKVENKRAELPDPRKVATQTQTQRKQSEVELTKKEPFLTRSTSLEGSQLSTGPQLNRNSTDFKKTKQAEADRAQEIFNELFGNVSNPNF